MSYIFLIFASLIVIISFFFNIISRKTSIPSVLLLIVLGILINWGMKFLETPKVNFFPILEILGIVGLIMIVLEAALDLELKKDKWPTIWKSFSVALLSLGGSTYLIALVLQVFINIDLLTSLIYAVPLSIMSSAIVIPSVANLDEHKKEFMIYESTFSDILGIMLFYFLIESESAENSQQLAISISANIGLTILISVLVGYLLVFTFQRIKSEAKLFFLISVLIVLYSIGKLFHLSSLLIILVFGMVLQNRHIFFRGFLKRLLHEESIKQVFDNFKVVTIESSFVIRTFFFVIFGMTLTLSSLWSLNVLVTSLIILIIIYGLRFILMNIFLGKNVFPQLLMVPRGLITILLFYAIPADFQVAEFDQGILLFIILFTSIIMAYALIKYKLGSFKDLTSILPSNEDVVDDIDKINNSINVEENSD